MNILLLDSKCNMLEVGTCLNFRHGTANISKSLTDSQTMHHNLQVCSNDLKNKLKTSVKIRILYKNVMVKIFNFQSIFFFLSSKQKHLKSNGFEKKQNNIVRRLCLWIQFNIQDSV